MSDELTVEELERLIGDWVVCGTCFDRQHRVVTLAFLTMDEDGRPALTPAEFMTFEKEPTKRYMPVINAKPEKFAPVELTCGHCGSVRQSRARKVARLPSGPNGSRILR